MEIHETRLTDFHGAAKEIRNFRGGEARGAAEEEDVEGSPSYRYRRPALHLNNPISGWRNLSGASAKPRPQTIHSTKIYELNFIARARARARPSHSSPVTCPPWSFLNAVILPVTSFRRFVKEKSWMKMGPS